MVNKLRNRGFDIFVHVVITLISAVMLYPFLYILAVSLSSTPEIIAGHVFILPRGFTILTYEYFLRLPTIARGYLNSTLYTTVGTLISLSLTVLCAYPLSKRWLWGRSFFAFFVILTMFVNGGLIPTFLTVKMLGMYNTIWALVLPGALNTFLLLITLTYFRSLPVELEEAAHIDGAGEFAVLTRVVLPLSRPILATLCVYYGVGYWNSWFPAAIYLKSSLQYPIQLILRNMMMVGAVAIPQQEMTSTFGSSLNSGVINIQALNYALTVAVILPIIFIYPFVQRYFVKGVLLGSIKG